MDYGIVMIGEWWRAVPVNGAQWQIGEWRAKVGRGRQGAVQAAKRAEIANQRKRDHPTRKERRYTDFVDAAVLRNTQQGNPPHPNNPRKGYRMAEITQKAPAKRSAGLRHVDWDTQGGPKNTRITGRLYEQCKQYAMHYGCTAEYAVNYFLQRGLQTLPPQQHDDIQPGGAE